VLKGALAPCALGLVFMCFGLCSLDFVAADFKVGRTTQGLVVSWVIDPLVVGNRPRALDRVENQYASENPERVRQATASQNSKSFLENRLFLRQEIVYN